MGTDPPPLLQALCSLSFLSSWTDCECGFGALKWGALPGHADPGSSASVLMAVLELRAPLAGEIQAPPDTGVVQS